MGLSEQQFWNRFDALFDSAFSPERFPRDGFFTYRKESTRVAPDEGSPTRAWKVGNDLEVKVDVPGVDPSDLKVRFVDGQIQVHAPRDGQDRVYSLAVSDAKVRKGSMTATVSNGVVTIVVKDAYSEDSEGFEVPVTT